MKFNFKYILNLIVGIVAIFVTISFLMFIYEYYNIAILKNIEYYPFGNENLSESHFYDSPESYRNAMIHFSIASFISSISIWYGIFKEKLKTVLYGLGFLILNLIVSNFIIY